jgi:hypothetical protein
MKEGKFCRATDCGGCILFAFKTSLGIFYFLGYVEKRKKNMLRCYLRLVDCRVVICRKTTVISILFAELLRLAAYRRWV